MREQTSAQDLARNVSDVSDKANEILERTAGDLEAGTQELREKLAHTLDTAKELYHKLEEQTIAGAKATDRCIRDHPYESLGVAFGAGLLVGFLITRK